MLEIDKDILSQEYDNIIQEALNSDYGIGYTQAWREAFKKAERKQQETGRQAYGGTMREMSIWIKKTFSGAGE